MHERIAEIRTLQAAMRVLDKYPQLRSPRAASLIDKFIREAGQQGDLARG
jgi:hypothetical protein